LSSASVRGSVVSVPDRVGMKSIQKEQQLQRERWERRE
jgi:hypothetical protein